MKPRRLTLISAALTLMLALHEAYSQGPPEGQIPMQDVSRDKILESLISTNRDVRLSAAVELDKQRTQLLTRLTAMLDSTNSDQVKVDAAIVLGEYRASEAVPVLVQHLEWDEVSHGGFFNGLIRREEFEEKTSPVSSALQKIGMPAVPALLERIAETDATNITIKCITICQNIEGWEVTQFRLNGVLEKESDLTSKVRIQSALRALERLKPAK